MRVQQMYYQVYYRIKKKFFKRDFKEMAPEISLLKWESRLQQQKSWNGKNSFSFLNLEKSFNSIDWNYTTYGKLWTYNLNYFDFLNQKEITKEEGVKLIKDFISQEKELKDGLEPYPISLRGINWIKFLAANNILDIVIHQTLFNHYQRLYNNLEYHLLGNHLLENGFSLLFGAYYFKDEKFYKKASELLKEELKEQVLQDGAHFELSPMYHQILLHRLLDSIQLLQLNNWKNDDLVNFLKEKATNMLSWLEAVTYKNCAIPMVNDSAYGISPSSKELFEYAKEIGLSWPKINLSDSGYRKFNGLNYECFMDVGNIGPDYIPGHAHADTFNFELYINEKPFIVDTGISTYEKNEIRNLERSTKSHNTVTVNNINSSDVWGGFRVGKRAKIIKFNEKGNEICALHDGYKNSGVVHQRTFKSKENSIIITDVLLGKSFDCNAFLHFHPSIKKINISNNEISLPALNLKIEFVGDAIRIEEEFYKYAKGFNKTEDAIKLKVSFKNNLQTSIFTS